MTAVLTPEEVEARLREPQTRSRIELASLALQAADALADLRRQLDEARAARDAHLQTVGELNDLWHLNVENVEAAERALAEESATLREANRRLVAVSLERDEARRHLSNLKHNDEHGFTAAAIRRAESVERALAEARAECERQRERAEKAEHWSQLRDEDIMKLGQELGKWQAAAEGERERIANILPSYGWTRVCETIRTLPPPTIEPSVTDTEKAMPDLTTLTALQERLRAATGPDRELDAVIGFEIAAVSRGLLSPAEIKVHDERGFDYVPHYTASVDAALALIERLGWCPHEMHFGPLGAAGGTTVYLCPPNKADEELEAEGNTAPIALLLALVAALIAREKANG